jgi:hypothetical protein
MVSEVSMSVNPVHAVAAALVLGLGVMTWITSDWERRLANADETLATFDFDASVAEYRSLERSIEFARQVPWLNGLYTEIREHRASAEYWQPNHVSPDADPRIRLLAANSAFRESFDEHERRAKIARLDDVIKEYAEVLKSSPRDFDAAYDYEYVTRLRDLLAKSHGDTETELPTTIYGKPGKLPEEKDMNQFKMLVPMEPEERSIGPREAGKGQKKVRKG